MLDHRKDSTEDISWEIVDEWGLTMDNGLGQSNPDLNSEIESPLQVAELTPDESQMVGFGRKERVTFSEGECQRLFHNAISCKTFLTKEKSLTFLSFLEAVQKILEVDFWHILKEYHGLKGWVSFKVFYKSLRTEEQFSKYLDTPTKYITRVAVKPNNRVDHTEDSFPKLGNAPEPFQPSVSNRRIDNNEGG